MIPLRTKLEISAGLVILAGAVLGFKLWLSEHDERVRAESDAAARQKAFDSLADERKQHAAEDRERDAAAAKQLEAMQAAAAKVQKPADIAAWIPKQIPGLPQPITINIPPATSSNPSPDALAKIPQADLIPLRDATEGCRENSLKLTTCEADLASRKRDAELADKQIGALQGRIQDLEKDLKGGTLWKRTKKVLKVAGCTAAGAAVGAYAAKEKGAAIGGAGSAIGCSVF